MPLSDLTQWWDRAHNFVIDNAATVGMPAALLYLFFFCTLLWQMEKSKKSGNSALALHGLQAGFLAYLTADFFSFDCFETYVLLFLFIGYSFYLIKESSSSKRDFEEGIIVDKIYKYKKILMIFIILILFVFVWFWNAKPFLINRQLNIIYSDFNSEKYEEAFKKIYDLYGIVIYQYRGG